MGKSTEFERIFLNFFCCIDVLLDRISWQLKKIKASAFIFPYFVLDHAMNLVNNDPGNLLKKNPPVREDFTKPHL